MEAKDTKLTREESNTLWLELWDNQKNEPPSLGVFSQAYLERQMEKTLKAGINEAMEWLRKYTGEGFVGYVTGAKKRIDIPKKDWQAQLRYWFKDNPKLLKEWGLRSG